jgi:2-polyprenyl-3-methyl-5-hydroxy-6-metoxy-1,4-benzoquinol methylase
VDRKFFVSQLRRCTRCLLLYRTPTDDPRANVDYYDNAYHQGFTTELPAEAALHEMIATRFVNTEKDYSYYVDVLRQLGLAPGMRIFDFGCSWGYGSHQLAAAGFDVTSFEVSTMRRRYADEKLGVKVVESMQSIAGSAEHVGQYQCFFSAHVLEHVPSPSEAFSHAHKLLCYGGVFVSFTPNGSEPFRSAAPADWHMAWGEVHPNFIDDIFLNRSFQNSPRAIGSSPVTNAGLPEMSTVTELDGLKNFELFFAARKTGPKW